MTKLADMATTVAPPWGRATWGSRLLKALVTPLDAINEWAFQGVKARFPLVGTPTALAHIGRDRLLRRGPAETASAFASRAVRWLDDHRVSGSPWALLDQLAGYYSPAPPLMRVVSSNGTSAIWYTRRPDGTREKRVATPTNWNWDGLTLRARLFVIIYDVSGSPYGTSGTWGGGVRKWGDGSTWGTSAIPDDVAGVLGVVTDWTAAHAVTAWVIHAFDPASFNPAAAAGSAGMPDGTWGRYHKTVAGVALPARLTTARYWKVS